MNKPTLHCFGCSFTNLETSDTGYAVNNFRNILSEKVDYVVKDHSHVGNSNEKIINDVYIHCNSIMNGDDIHIIQFSFNDRLGLYSDFVDEFISICKLENPDNYAESIFIKFYNDWLKYFYSRKSRALEFRKQVDFMCAWLRSKNVKFICFAMDFDADWEHYTNSFYELNNFIKFENTYSLYGYMSMNKLRIADLPEYNKARVTDYHLNNDGHNYIANKILEKIQNKQFY